MPKYKIKKSKPFTETKIESKNGKVEYSKESDFPKAKKTKIKIRKSKKPVKPTLMDARAITDEEGKILLEQERLKGEKKRGKKLLKIFKGM